jgi:hypothetical protein
MYTRRLQERTPSAVALETGFVEGYRLTFDKVSTDGSGKCNIERTADLGDRVYGVLFSIAVREVDKLDAAEGLSKGYRKSELRVVGRSGAYTALAYIADSTDPLLRPYDWYKKFVVRGAIEHALPAAYLRRLQLTDAKPDPDPKRSARNKALLPQR